MIKNLFIPTVLTIALVFAACKKSDEGEIELMDNTDNNKNSELLADIPSFKEVAFICENNCGDGVNLYYKSTGRANDIMILYKTALSSAGWEIDSSGGISTGASLFAKKGGKYLKLNIGEPSGGNQHIDLAIWPTEPADKNCNNCVITPADKPEQPSPEALKLSQPLDSSRSLSIDLPIVSQYSYQCENTCGEGIHRFYKSSGDALSLAEDYSSKLRTNGWGIVIEAIGDANNASVEAVKGGRYLEYKVSGENSSLMNIDISIWPDEPENRNCKNCELFNGSTKIGDTTNADTTAGGGSLLVGVPHVYSLEPIQQAQCNDGQYFYYRSGTSPQVVVPDYKRALEENGWAVGFVGGGSTYGWGLKGTNGSRYIYLNMGVGNIELCVWPSQTTDICGVGCDE